MLTIEKGFGHRVSAIRLASGLGKEAFARDVLSEGASAKNISRIEAEEVTPREATLRKISAYGNVNMEWLTTGRCVLKPTDVVTTIGLGARIAKAREAAGMNCRELAKASSLGASSKNVSRYEKGEHRPTYRTVEKLAAALKVNPAHLAFGV